MISRAQSKIFYISRIPNRVGRVSARFSGSNAAVWTRIVSAAVSGAAIVVYVAALIMGFNLRMRIDSALNERYRREQEVKQREIALREAEANLVSRHRDFIENMQAVSAVKYLTPGGMTVSQVSGRTPQ